MGLITTLLGSRIANRERLFGSNRWVEVGRGQLWSDQSPSWTQLRFLTATVHMCLRARDQNFFKNFGCKHANTYTPMHLFLWVYKPWLHWDNHTGDNGTGQTLSSCYHSLRVSYSIDLSSHSQLWLFSYYFMIIITAYLFFNFSHEVDKIYVLLGRRLKKYMLRNTGFRNNGKWYPF